MKKRTKLVTKSLITALAKSTLLFIQLAKVKFAFIQQPASMDGSNAPAFTFNLSKPIGNLMVADFRLDFGYNHA